VVAVRGQVRADLRIPKPQFEKGKVEIYVEEMEVLNAAKTPPFI
jgi:aspartyl-tRNA synthetase